MTDISFSASDRVLLLSLSDPALAASLAGHLPDGLLVALDPDDDTMRAARRVLRDQENVMCAQGTAAEIPWRDDFFTKVIDPLSRWPDPFRALAQISRVLAPGGRAFLALDALDPATLEAVSLRPDGREAGLLVLASTKPDPDEPLLSVLR